MKVCPVCRARTFDDAEVCYGCLYHFGGDAARGRTAVEEGWEPDEGAAALRAGADGGSGGVDGAVDAAWAREGRRVGAVEAVEPRAGRVAVAADGEVGGIGGVLPGRRARSSCARVDALHSDGAGACGAAHARALPEEGSEGSGTVDPSRPSRAAAQAQGRSPRGSAVPCGTDGAGAAARESAPFDQAGWIVRFELPGCSTGRPPTESGAALSARDGDGLDVRLDEDASGSLSRSLVVSIRPVRGERQRTSGACGAPASHGAGNVGSTGGADGADGAESRRRAVRVNRVDGAEGASVPAPAEGLSLPVCAHGRPSAAVARSRAEPYAASELVPVPVEGARP